MFPPFGYMSLEPCAFTPRAGMIGLSLRMPVRVPITYFAPASFPC